MLLENSNRAMAKVLTKYQYNFGAAAQSSAGNARASKTASVCPAQFSMDNYTVDPVYGCWLYAGRLDKDGYGTSWSHGRPYRVHRRAWEQANGPIPAGMELDHGCRRRHCLRLEHLALVTRSENERLKAFRRRIAPKACPRGHDLYLNGRLTPEGGKICRVCSGI